MFYQRITEYIFFWKLIKEATDFVEIFSIVINLFPTCYHGLGSKYFDEFAAYITNRACRQIITAIQTANLMSAGSNYTVN